MSSSPTLLLFAAVSASTLQVHAAGVSVGGSSLLSVLDYSDTFTQTSQGGRPDRPDTAAVQPAAAYVVENNYGNPSVSFSIGSGFSFASDTAGLVNGFPAYPGSSGAGSATGITQTGSGIDYALPYGLRSSYLVQVDAVQVSDRIDISSGSAPGIFAGNSLSVFFRADGNASIFNGALDTSIRTSNPLFNTGITGAGQWYNYAVRFDQSAKQIELYVNQLSLGIIDLNTFAGGAYANFSNAFVGAGAGLGGTDNRTWTDNFQVGAPVPEAASALLVLAGFAGLALRRQRRA